MRTVRVGESSYTLAPFRGFKAELVGDIITGAANEAEEVAKAWTEFNRDWEERNKLKITADLCSRRAADFREAAAVARRLAEKAPEKIPESAEDGSRDKTRSELEAEARQFEARAESWAAQRKELGERPYIEVPNPEGAPFAQAVAHVFPKAFAVARDEVKKLLALVVIPNADLQAADEEGKADETLTQLGKRLFYEGELGELLELAVAAGEQIESEFERYAGPVGKLRALLERALSGVTQQKSPETQETSTTDSPSSSTPSQPPTDGAEEKSSSESPTPSSLASSAA